VIVRRFTFSHLSQLLSHAAVLLCELAVLSRVFPVFISMTIVLFGCFLVCLCGSVVTVCGFVHADGCRPLGCLRFSPCLLRSLSGAKCFFGSSTARLTLAAQGMMGPSV
jgi:hypothetical protein